MANAFFIRKGQTMFIECIKVKNFRCFENVEFDFTERMTVIAGDNGSGKTAVLEAAAIAAGTMFQPMDELSGKSINKRDAALKPFPTGSLAGGESQFPVEIEAKGTPESDSIEWKRSLNGPEGKTTIMDARPMTDLGKRLLSGVRSDNKAMILPVLAYYGTGRLWDYHREKRTDTFKRTSRLNGYIDSLDGTANIKLMMNWFKKMTVQKYQNQENGKGKIPEFDVVCKAIETYYEQITGNKEAVLQFNLGTNELDIYYNEGGKRMCMPLSQLSDGYKGTLSLIADIAYRMSLLNPDLMEEAITRTPGLVLIDEVDLHLHPTWQERIVEDLMTIFPQVQFIVTTHAPIVINSIRSDNLILLRDKQPGSAGLEVYGKDANSIIQSVMRSNERPVRVKKMFEDFYSAVDEGMPDKARVILNRIEKEIGTDDAETAACEVQLSLEEA